jgi:hypothetical protein
MMRSEVEQAAIAESGVSTEKLVTLALTRPVRDLTNELYGRSHAWYAIASTQEQAREFIAAQTPDEQRRMASRALAMAGYAASDIA